MNKTMAASNEMGYEVAETITVPKHNTHKNILMWKCEI
jgi:hypothetical protein